MTDSTYLHTLPKDILVNHICKLVNNISFSFEIKVIRGNYHWTMNISFFNTKLLIKGYWEEECWGIWKDLDEFDKESVCIRCDGNWKTINENFLIISKNNEYVHFSNQHIELDVPMEYIETQLNNAINELYKLKGCLESMPEYDMLAD